MSKQCSGLTDLNIFLLENFTVEIISLLQFLQDLLDSLFYILMQNTVSDLYDNLVFDALVSVSSLLHASVILEIRRNGSVVESVTNISIQIAVWLHCIHRRKLTLGQIMSWAYRKDN